VAVASRRLNVALERNGREAPEGSDSTALQSAALVAAIAWLNASLSFHNIWPTPAIAWRGELSIELAVVLLLMVAAHRSIGLARPRREPRAPSSEPSAGVQPPPVHPRSERIRPSAIVRILTVLWIGLVIGHYADVTTPALYGRDINLYFDLRFMPDVAAMVVRAAPFWLIGLVVITVAVVVWLLYLAFRWAFERIVEALAMAGARLAMALLAVAVLGLFTAQHLSDRLANDPIVTFATPVTETYVRQARLVMDARSGAKTLPPSPPMDADLARVRGADVFLVFIEAYGAVAYERSDIAPGLGASRAALDAAIRASADDVVSAFVESPTFGGSSWLAHLSLMSGVEVRDAASNASLMTQQRETIVTTFAKRGYRTVALMPGLRQRWPEGGFYGFDQIYGATELAYRGPEFGWFAIPDQYSLARFEALESARPARPPLFVFYPTISTHFPFSPTPPYQPDWSRIATGRPYDGPAIVDAYSREPDWRSFGPGYVDAVSYTYMTLAGYLAEQAGRDRIYVVLGDHQPAAAVSGEGAPWDVPVHVIVSIASGHNRADVLERLRARGFRSGLTPERPALGRMHTLLPLLLGAFSGRD
jgi:hypothetical protein